MFDQESGLTLIPPNRQPKFALGVSVWGEPAEKAFHAFVQREAASGGLDRISRLPGQGETVMPVKVQLVPRPDNDYNPKAVSVAAPPEHPGTDHERHVGYMYDRNLVALGGPIRALAYATGGPVGCHAYVQVRRVGPKEYRKRKADYGSAITASHNLMYSYTDSDIRLLMPWWEDLQQMAIAYTRTLRPELILPFTGHWAPWKPGARQELAARTQEHLFPITLRCKDGELLAYHQDLLLACLWPSGRDFFDRTVQRVQELGGSACAYAEDYEGSIKVYVEDSSPRT
ncbi:hypothetical protein LE181_01690 [Streptomyces sp. SCA3-4]|uniref:hypothetical protein n=1 Tax=Streptomyces sichuanensis TaxID=2871810 RepID=UPI001CE3A010|nr:hypothetical protein [Streptomyces sichuanensis]MCA6090895.1 hypothetical protein [Streptomyces sichuanensis]